VSGQAWFQGSTSTPLHAWFGAIQLKAEASSTHKRTLCPAACSWRAKRQHTPKSPWLSMTWQKMSQRFWFSMQRLSLLRWRYLGLG
jgi:hypothetical protein